jgi:hypothetical protein
MNESQANKAVFIMAGILIAAAFLEGAYSQAKNVKGKAGRDLLVTQFNIYKRLWVIGLLTLVMAISADFVPEVAGPLALLILVSVAVHDSKYFSEAFSKGTVKA